MKKIIVASVIAGIAVATAAATFFLALRNDSVSEKMAIAVKAQNEGDDALSRKILRAVVAKDASNEEAFRMLAANAERAGLFEDAGVFLTRVAALNPLDKDITVRMFDNFIRAHSDAYIALEYNARPDSPSLPERIRYCAALAFVRQGEFDKFAEIFDDLKEKNSKYAPLLEAETMLARSNTANAERIFFESRSDHELHDYAVFGLARCSMTARNPAAALARIKELKGVSPEIPSDAEIMLARISLLSKNFPAAFSHYRKAAEMQRSNVMLMLETAEIAVVVKNFATISAFRKILNTSDKRALMLDYYLSALEYAARGENARAYDALSLSGDFQIRPTARILAAKFACELDKPKAAAAALDALPVAIPRELRKALAADVGRLIKKHSSDAYLVETFSESLLKLSPDDIFALRTVLAAKLVAFDYTYAYALAERLLRVSPKDSRGVEGMAASLLKLGRNSAGLDFIKPFADAPNADQFAIVYAARFCAALGNRADAMRYMLMSLRGGRSDTRIALEFGRWLAVNAEPKYFDEFVLAVERAGGDINGGIAKILRSEFAYKNGDIAEAKSLMAQAVKKLPKVELAYVLLAVVEYVRGNSQSARAALEEGIKNIPDSISLKLRLASLLIDGGDRADILHARTELSKFAAMPNPDPMCFAELSDACAALGDGVAALEAARAAERIAPDNPRVLVRLGERLCDGGSGEEALKYLLRAVRRSKNRRVVAALERSLQMAASNALSEQSKKVYANSVLRVLPQSEIAKKISDEARLKIEQER